MSENVDPKVAAYFEMIRDETREIMIHRAQNSSTQINSLMEAARWLQESEVFLRKLRGDTWEEIGTRLGISRQAAHKAFAGKYDLILKEAESKAH